jgi:TPR repeat protein
MLRLVFLTILFALCDVTAVQAQSFALNERNKGAIGIVTVRVLTNGTWKQGDYFDRGTGAIISQDGYVLTAMHLMTNDVFNLCVAATGSSAEKQCEVSFLRGGDPSKSYKLTVSSERSASHDFMVFKLPAARDVLGQPYWPSAILARRAVDSENIHYAGYTGSDPISAGGGNPIELSDGRLYATYANQTCDGEGFGIARRASGQPSPGWSGGPVFNGSGRIVGITLGPVCSNVGATSPNDAPKMRVLLISDIPGLCSSVAYSCSFGFPGDIEPQTAGTQRSWTQRLLNGSQIADQIVYGVKPIELARVNILTAACGQLNSDQSLVESVKTDADSGSQLAGVYLGILPGCRQGATNSDVDTGLQQLIRLADLGYPPAQYAVGLFLGYKVAPKLAGRQPNDQISLTEYDRSNLDRAALYFRAAAAQGWTAASFAMFQTCTQRLVSCTRQETTRYLDISVADLQLDALRTDAQFLMIGQDGGIAEKRFGFSRPLNSTRALELLEKAALPRAGATSNTQIFIYDNLSAGYLAFFYGGGRYRNRVVAPSSAIKTLQYSNECFGGMLQPLPLSEFCRWVGALGGFNVPNDSASRAANWTFLMTMKATPTYGNYAANLESWSPDGKGVDRISCDLSEGFDFRPPATLPTPEAGVAYCYFPKLK